MSILIGYISTLLTISVMAYLYYTIYRLNADDRLINFILACVFAAPLLALIAGYR